MLRLWWELRRVRARDSFEALGQLTLIVRGADIDTKDLTLESHGLVVIAEGFRLVYDDHAQLAAELPVYDALYAVRQKRLAAS